MGTPRMGYLSLMNCSSSTLVTSCPPDERTTMACFSGPRMRMPSMSACPPMVVRNAPWVSFLYAMNVPFCMHSISQLVEKCNSCSIIYSSIFGMSHASCGRRMVTTAAAALGVADVKAAAVAGDDLIADRQADAAASGLGGALVEFLLHVGQLRLRDAGAVVPDADDLRRPPPGSDGRRRCACRSRRAWRRCPARCRTPASAAPGRR